jgi:hypothetical protein
MATLALNSGLWVRRLLIGGSPHQGRYPASEVNDGACPEKPDHLASRLLRLRVLQMIQCTDIQRPNHHASGVVARRLKPTLTRSQDPRRFGYHSAP